MIMAMHSDFSRTTQTVQSSSESRHTIHGTGYHTICPRQSGLLCGSGERKSSAVGSCGYGKNKEMSNKLS